MKIRLGLISWATGMLMLAAVSACGGSDTDPPATAEPPSTSTSPSAPTTTASPSSPSDAASADATEAVRSYFTVVDQLRNDPAADLKKLKSVATSAQLNAVETLIGRQRDEGQRQTGTTAINELQVQSVNLDNSDPKAGKVPTVVIDVCWDVSKVDVLNKSGKSIVSPNRPDTGWTRYTVANYDYAADPTGGWRVATGQDLRQDAMRGILIRLLLTALSVAGLSVLVHAPSYADTVCSQTDPATGECLIWIEVPGTPGTPGEPDDDGPQDTGSGAACYWDGTSQGIKKPPPGPVPCSSPAGYWSNSYHCYISPVEPQPPAGDPSWQGHEPGDGAVYDCYQPQTDMLITIWSQDPPPNSGTGPTPREVAQTAIEQMHLSAINIGIAPEPGPDSIGLVGMPVWMWAKDPNAHTVGPITESASAGGITVTATAKVLHITWDMGDGTEVVCETAGTPYKPSYGRKDSPDCGHTYKKSSARQADDAYTVTATSSWVITWSGAGQTGTIRLDGLNRSTQIRIGEAQVLVN